MAVQIRSIDTFKNKLTPCLQMFPKLDNNNDNNNNKNDNNTFEGVRETRYFSPFFIISRNNVNNLIFDNSQNMWIFLAQMNNTC